MTRSVASRSRREVTRDVLWGAPALVLATAAPALAGSVCTSEDLLTATPKASSEADEITFEGPDGLVVTAELIGATAKTLRGNLNKSGENVILYQSAAAGQYQDVKFTFSRPAYNVSFKVLDLDNWKRQVDFVTVTGDVKAKPVVKGFLEIEENGTGITASAPVPQTDADAKKLDENSPEGQALITSEAGQAMSGFTLRYGNRRSSSGSGGQAVWISPISYTNTNC